MARYVDIDKHVYVRYIDEHSGKVVTSLHTIAEILDNTVGLFPVEDDVKKVVLCEDCKHGRPYKHTKEYVACEVDCDPIDRDSDFFCRGGERRE